MIIIADSGSTKTDWRFIDEEKGITVYNLKTVGFNPYFQDSDFIYNTLLEVFKDVIQNVQNQVNTIYYYGAGCSSDDKKIVVSEALVRLFPLATPHIDHDLIGASRATLGTNSGIACILGTGANSCVWDGNDVVENIPSHGYIFGDEGSGSYLGKELLKLYLNNEMDVEMKQVFVQEFNIFEEEILESTYKLPNPNVFLASFARFYSLFPHSKELTKIVQFGFNDFFQRRVIKYNDYILHELGFVGSIAYHFHEDLSAVAKLYGIKIKSIEKCPIDKLVEFHLSQNKIKI